MKICTLLLFLLVISLVSFSQTFEKTFSGQWAMTTWSFQFYKDGTYTRISSGHYGNPEYTGNYSINGDTLQILTGYENSNGTVNEYYLLDGDSLLVDLDLLYDYKLNADPWSYNSKKRYEVLPKPHMDSVITIPKKDFINYVSSCSAILTNYQISDIEDHYHLMIIRCYNTISFDRVMQLKTPYKEFIDLINKKDYVNQMSKRYDWIPNRGQGFYFQKLQIELMGTPHQFSMYRLVE